MGVWNRIKSLFPVIVKRSDMDRWFSSAPSLTGRRQVQEGNAKQAVEEYKSWVYVCASRNATGVASVPLRLYATKQGKTTKLNYLTRKVLRPQRAYMESSKILRPYLAKAAEVVEVVEHPFLDLMANVNSFWNQFDMMELVTLFLEQTGDAYWYIPVNKLGVPAEIWVLPSQNMTIIPSKETFISHYEYRAPGQATPLKFGVEEIVHFRYPSLTSLYYGWSPFYAANAPVNANNYMAQYTEATFKNMARPDMVFETKDEIDKDTATRMLRSWKEKYQGAANVGKGAFLPPGYKASKFSLTPQELDYLEGRKWTRGEICAIYGQTEALVATEGVPRANLDAAIYLWMSSTIRPRTMRIEQKINEQLMPMYDEKLFVAFDNCVPEDRELRLAEIKTHFETGYSTTNEEREIDGKEALDDGDDRYLPMNLIPVGEAARINEGMKIVGTAKKLEGKGLIPDVISLTDKELLVERLAKKQDDMLKKKSQRRLAQWTKFIELTQPQERRLKLKLVKIFRAQEKEVLANLHDLETRSVKQPEIFVPEILFDKDRWDPITMQLAQQELADSIRIAGEDSLSTLTGMTFDMNTEAVQEFILSNSEKFTAKLNETTLSHLKLTLQEGVQLGEGIPKLRKRIMGVFDSATRSRAEMIARTEIIKSSNFAAEQSFIQSGVVEGKEWSTAFDERTCPMCMDMDGKTAPLGGSYFSEGERHTWSDGTSTLFDYEDIQDPPLHPRCYSKDTEVYTREGWKLISEINGSEILLTLVPDTKDLEWNRIDETVKDKEEFIYEITNKQSSFNMAVTLDHPFFGYQRVDRGKNGRKPEPITIDGVNNLHSEFRFYTSSKWTGKDRPEIAINGIIFETADFCRLMGYYLSEGSTVRRTTGRYQISIAQSNHLDKFWQDLKCLPVRKIWLGKDKIYIADNRLGEYLITFGKSYEKYIPDIIKELDPFYIQLFLDAYLLGDGSIKKGKDWKNGHFEDSRSYCTSSKRTADDLGELIIKTGKSVSYRLDHKKGEVQKFRNGIYTINHDIWIINELTSQYKFFGNLTVEKKPYNDFVYDLEVENHTILTRRKGKVVWGSNCRCTILPIVREI